ncbi:hypothetical protein L7F22_069056 [Adiantum nelumboides]|nr:hypothetical protein [Adiantum nelumboides]
MASRVNRTHLSALYYRLLWRSSTSPPPHHATSPEFLAYSLSANSPSQRFFSAGRTEKPVSAKQVFISRGLGSRVATINNPKRLNALSTSMARKLRTFYERWECEEGVNMVILQGAGGVFSSGADVKELYRLGLQVEWARQSEQPTAIMLLDFEKAYVRVDWDMLVDNLLSQSVRQGCPLTPYLFPFFAETMALPLRSRTTQLQDLHMPVDGSRDLLEQEYVDDTMLFCQNAPDSLDGH